MLRSPRAEAQAFPYGRRAPKGGWDGHVSANSPDGSRLLSALSGCLSETGFCRIMRSRSFSKASTPADSFFTCALTAFNSGSLILLYIAEAP